MFCTKCGNKNPDGAFCCSSCGTPLNQPSQQPYNQAPPMSSYQVPVDIPQQPVYNAVPEEPEVPVKGLGVASMIIGIVSLAIFCLWPFTLPSSIAGLVLGSIASNKAKDANVKNGMAQTGVICSSIALGLAIISLILYFIGMSAAFMDFYY